MIHKKLLIICLLIISGDQIHAQNKYLGIKSGFIPIITSEFDTKSSGYFIGLKAEYVPKKAIFSLSGDIQYMSPFETLLIPISFNFRVGGKVKFRTSAAVVPIINLRQTPSPNNHIRIGSQLGTGLEVCINRRISICGEGGIYFIPYSENHTSMGGLAGTYQYKNRCRYISIGFQRDFGKIETIPAHNRR